ncbi:MAG: hypothetical protein CMK00_06800 [Planctomycetes bacterium]|nr:hypothetical protein [Planctomycetota bacterium]
MAWQEARKSVSRMRERVRGGVDRCSLMVEVRGVGVRGQVQVASRQLPRGPFHPIADIPCSVRMRMLS